MQPRRHPWTDPAAFAALVARHEPRVMGLGQSLGLSGADLDDAAAETFAAVYRGLHRFDGRAEIGTWVYRVAYRVIVKARHRARRHRRRAGPLADDRPAAESRTDLETAESADAVWAAVAELDPRQAAAVELHYRQSLSIDRIADVLQCPAGTVKTLLFRARQRLRHVLSEREVYP